MLDFIYFTYNYLEESIRLTDGQLFNRPIIARDRYHSQFKLNLNDYIDNNNFLRINFVETKDSRWALIQEAAKFKFIDL